MADFDTQRSVQKNRIRRRGIYLLPNLFTTAALFAGFYATVQAMNLRFDQAAVAIFVAMVLDGLDGRVARLTRTQSAFGAEYDSLADMVSFGAAPALIVYEWALKGMGNLGWIAAFVYVAGAALRLARFNVMLDVADKRWFTGIPESGGGRAGRGPRVDHRRPFGRSRRDSLVGVGRDAVRGPHDGQQRSVLQLQVDQPQEERAVPCDLRVRPRHRAPGGRSGERAVRRGGRLCAFRLRRVRVDVVRAPPAARADAAPGLIGDPSPCAGCFFPVIVASS
jgi:CDP-diacylglycerol--serine O-phosphatidyltransferase